MRILCLFLCGVLSLFVALAHSADGKKKADPKKKAEEALLRQDEPKNWPACDTTSFHAIDQGLCLYIKDARMKKNPEADFYEGTDLLLNDSLRVKLRGLKRVKVKSDGTDSKGWPAEWLKAGHNGAVLIIASGDGTLTGIFERKGKSGPSLEAINELVDKVVKHQAERKASADAKAKADAELAKKNAPPPPKPEIPGLGPSTAAPKKDKPKEKGPQDE